MTVVSGGDTNILGSQVSGGKVVASVGGDLTIQSVQDTTVSSAHQSSASGGIGVSTVGGGASFSAQNGHGDGTYANVNEQAGIQAGAGGFDISVAGNTGLTGAVIARTADASKNSLTTGTLTFSDIQNQSHYDATSNGVSAGGSIGSSGKAVGPSSVSGSGGIVPMMSQNDSGDQSGTTRSAIGAGTISLTNQAGQTQDAASLSRETSGANGTVSATPDVSSLLSQQADTMQAAQAAGQTVAQGIGAYADKKRDDAIADAQAADKRGDTQAAQKYWGDAASWTGSGANRVALHMAGGALIGGLGGGSVFTAAGGAAAAGTASYFSGTSRTISSTVGGETGSALAGQVAANVLVTMGGALIGGSAGAAAAANVNLYNKGNDNTGLTSDELIAQGTGGSGSNRTSLTVLALKGLADGLNAVSALFGFEGGMPPPANPGAVLVNGVTQALAEGMSSIESGLGYGSSNAIFSAGSNNDTSSPVLTDDPYNPSNVDARVNPSYQANPAHNTGSPLYNPKKTPEPPDAQSAYEDGAVRGGMGTWYAQGETGYYQYFSDNAGTVHFSGTVPASKIPASVLKILGK